MSIVRIVVADDHPLVLRGIGDFLDSVEGFEVVGACPDGMQALDAIRTLAPDVAILDLSMPILHGLEVLAATNRENLVTRIIFLSAYLDSREIMLAMADGACGILPKDSPLDELSRCVRDVAAGDMRLPYWALQQQMREAESQRALIPIERLLTRREWGFAALVADGLSNRQIASRLGVTEGTARTRLSQIYRKLGVRSRTALMNIRFKCWIK